MSAETTAATKKRASGASPNRTSEDDHRRKRRNRPTQSCLNCHTSKRMCDRQRPCGRCTQLGLTGLCVYEVDNPSHRANAQDEAGRLKKRVAELESIIRELKNKPHPRWAQPGQPGTDEPEGSLGGTNKARSSTASASASDTSSSPPPQSPRASRFPTPPSSGSGFLEPGSASSPSALTGSPSPLNTPSPVPQSPIDVFLHSGTDADPSGILYPDYDLSSLLVSYQSSSAALDDTFLGDMLDPLLPPTPEMCANHRTNEHCGCLNDHTSYNTVLELSLRLRRATEILSQYAKHTSGSRTDCKVHKGITDLDRFTTTALGNIVSPPEVVISPAPQTHPRNASVPTSAVFGRPPFAGAAMRPTPNLGIPPASLSPQSVQSPRTWDFKQAHTGSYPSPPWEDSFMSWEPLRHQ